MVTRRPTSSSVITTSSACRHVAMLPFLVQIFPNEESTNIIPVPWMLASSRPVSRNRSSSNLKEHAVTKPEILGSQRSSYTRVVRMVCEEKGIDYVLTETLLGAPELRHIHPFGKMPVLRDGDFELCESKAIATYLDRRFPGPQLIPDDPHLAALTEQWVSLVNTVMDATLVRTYLLAYAVPKTADGKPDPNTIEVVTPAVRPQLEILDKAVAATGYLVGDQFTLA